jgi:hypothetical protein
MGHSISSFINFWLCSEPAASPRYCCIRTVISAVLAAIAISWGLAHMAPLFSAPQRPVLPCPEIASENRYGLPLARRQKIFSIIAKREAVHVQQAMKSDKRPWRQQNLRGISEYSFLRTLAKEQGIHLSVAYSILQEGIRDHWTAGAGQTPLTATIVPLQQK